MTVPTRKPPALHPELEGVDRLLKTPAQVAELLKQISDKEKVRDSLLNKAGSVHQEIVALQKELPY